MLDEEIWQTIIKYPQYSHILCVVLTAISAFCILDLIIGYCMVFERNGQRNLNAVFEYAFDAAISFLILFVSVVLIILIVRDTKIEHQQPDSVNTVRGNQEKVIINEMLLTERWNAFALYHRNFQSAFREWKEWKRSKEAAKHFISNEDKFENYIDESNELTATSIEENTRKSFEDGVPLTNPSERGEIMDNTTTTTLDIGSGEESGIITGKPKYQDEVPLEHNTSQVEHSLFQTIGNNISEPFKHDSEVALESKIEQQVFEPVLYEPLPLKESSENYEMLDNTTMNDSDQKPGITRRPMHHDEVPLKHDDPPEEESYNNMITNDTLVDFKCGNESEVATTTACTNEQQVFKQNLDELPLEKSSELSDESAAIMEGQILENFLDNLLDNKTTVSHESEIAIIPERPKYQNEAPFLKYLNPNRELSLNNITAMDYWIGLVTRGDRDKMCLPEKKESWIQKLMLETSKEPMPTMERFHLPSSCLFDDHRNATRNYQSLEAEAASQFI